MLLQCCMASCLLLLFCIPLQCSYRKTCKEFGMWMQTLKQNSTEIWWLHCGFSVCRKTSVTPHMLHPQRAKQVRLLPRTSFRYFFIKCKLQFINSFLPCFFLNFTFRNNQALGLPCHTVWPWGPSLDQYCCIWIATGLLLSASHFYLCVAAHYLGLNF